MKKMISIGMYDDKSLQETDCDGLSTEQILTQMNAASEGTLFVFEAEKNNGTSIIMFPGGGFKQVNLKNEGYDFAEWFTSRGFTFAVCKYRSPNGNYRTPNEDAQNAMRTMKERFPKQTKRIGIMGASIGGYFAAAASTLLPDEDKCDFQIMLYPVTSMSNELAHVACRERMFGTDFTPKFIEPYSPLYNVDATTPDAFIVANADDPAVSPLNSILYAGELQKASIPVSLHIYPSGGHAFGFKDEYPYKKLFLAELDEWLKQLA